jgi:hypothetical protein
LESTRVLQVKGRDIISRRREGRRDLSDGIAGARVEAIEARREQRDYRYY